MLFTSHVTSVCLKKKVNFHDRGDRFQETAVRRRVVMWTKAVIMSYGPHVWSWLRKQELTLKMVDE